MSITNSHHWILSFHAFYDPVEELWWEVYRNVKSYRPNKVKFCNKQWDSNYIVVQMLLIQVMKLDSTAKKPANKKPSNWRDVTQLDSWKGIE